MLSHRPRQTRIYLIKNQTIPPYISSKKTGPWRLYPLGAAVYGRTGAGAQAGERFVVAGSAGPRRAVDDSSTMMQRRRMLTPRVWRASFSRSAKPGNTPTAPRG